MIRSLRLSLAHSTFLLSLLAGTSIARAQWTAPTDEELKMTSQAEVPGAPLERVGRAGGGDEIVAEGGLAEGGQAGRRVLLEEGDDLGDDIGLAGALGGPQGAEHGQVDGGRRRGRLAHLRPR